jgi:hypothetical protein
MADIEMPPQYAGEYSDPKDSEGHVDEAVRTMAADRVNQWTTKLRGRSPTRGYCRTAFPARDRRQASDSR